MKAYKLTIYDNKFNAGGYRLEGYNSLRDFIKYEVMLLFKIQHEGYSAEEKARAKKLFYEDMTNFIKSIKEVEEVEDEPKFDDLDLKLDLTSSDFDLDLSDLDLINLDY